VVSGFRRDVIFALFWDITQRIVVIPYRRFETTYRSHLQEIQGDFLEISWPYKKGPIVCPETSLRNYHYMLSYIPEERRSLLLLSQTC